ncbi:Vancomycin resistance protein YoaR, contains peptidoglycan-binding and VanW domains [Caloranaerobacter azorensis DSM 13643]|uniref:Vancomycin resistance protein YoaR, contains peptidoglycan-binding and VanW domains n=1 Tax=Caloranaerobacter azorensis DSM 13643 TaxID=1121264 RepID=A0A1M5UBA9_9FIRM|nr:VanW family protein [Caloranaerobacter azorensis]SHH60257.1 Vancomycin resistance protein YoaR, contains peptidoglycan-binding and VanW domains [Caloranaerobacter azorensis DSM 13643]
MSILNRYFVKIFVSILIVLILLSAIFIFVLLNITTIHKGVKINDIDVGGLNRNEAILYLEKELGYKLNNKFIKLIYENYKYIIEYKELGITYDYYKAVDEAFLIGRQGNMIKRIKDILHTRINGCNIEMGLLYDDVNLRSIIDRVSKDIDVESKDAYIVYSKSGFKLFSEVYGKRVNKEELESRIIKAILAGGSVEIPVEIEEPKITEDMLKHIKDRLGSFTTNFAGSSLGRKYNIKLASSSINGKVILPGEIFSFNETTGPRDANAGYKEAKIILDGDLTSGVGGGVCQVSTTLYNAVLLSDLKIEERHPHSIPATYVKKGLDATVAYDYLDFKFSNNTDYPVYIHSEIKDNRLTITIFGKKVKKNRVIKIKSKIIQVLKPEVEIKVDKNLKPGTKNILQKGRYGYKVKTYKEIYENGKKIKTEVISSDYYRPRKEIIKIGPGQTDESH